MNKKVEHIKNKLTEIVCHGTQFAVEAALKENDDKSDGAATAVYIASHAAFSALMLAAPILAKKPPVAPKTDEEKEEIGKIVSAALNTETVLLAALISARMFQGNRSGKMVNIDGKEGMEVETEMDFSPLVLHQAIEDWKKITEKDPADYFQPSLLKAVKEAVQDSTNPFDEFLAKRQTAPSSKTLN